MNGEQQTAPSGSCGQNVLYALAPCCIAPCGSQRRSEYLKSLKSLSVPLGLLQIIIFIACLGVGGMQSPKQNPLFGPPATTLVQFGAKQAYLIQRGQVFRFLTPMLLHGGIIHLLMNLLCQWRFGLFVERRWGTLKYAAVYVGSGVGAVLLACLASPNKIGVGASGALMGILGGFVGELALQFYKLTPTTRPLLIQAAVWSAIGLLLGIAPFIDFFAHAGGWITGFLIGIALHSHTPDSQRNRILALAIPATLLGLYAVIGTVVFWTSIHPVRYDPNM